MKPNRLLDSTALRGDELRAVFERDGCVLLRGVLPRDEVLRARRAVLEKLSAAGLMSASSPIEEARARPGLRPNDLGTQPLFVALLRIEALHRLFHHPALVSVVEELLGEPAIRHPTMVVRAPGPGFPTTPPHQDGESRPGGATRTVTAWIPLGDLDAEREGAICYQPGSHRAGLVAPSILNAGSLVSIDPATLEDRWWSASFRAGDVTLHHHHVVHASLPNVSEHFRLSLDSRFQPRSQPIAAPYTKTNYGMPVEVPWDDIYRGWQSRDLQYYWREPGVNITTEFDDPHLLERYRLACGAARRGDRIGGAAVRVLLQHFAVPSLRAEAEAALAEYERQNPRPTARR